jgi:3-hydroxymyristoyl/3-hydroxydecanoyl-(acyl carrier protein) dehydratase
VILSATSKLNIPNDDILAYLPQRPPFVMVGKLVECDVQRYCTSFEIGHDNVLVEKGEFSEAGLVENIAQTAAAGKGFTAQQLGEPIFTGYIVAVKNLEISALPKAGDLIETEVIIDKQIFDFFMITGTVRVRGAVVAACEMKIFINTNAGS